MLELDVRTRRQRGCDAFGGGAKSSIMLYSDNCRSHSSEKQIKLLSKRGRIEVRALTPNASHVQQPVDQNVGLTMKNDIKSQYRRYVDEVYSEFDKGERTEKVGAQERRAKIVSSRTMRRSDCRLGRGCCVLVGSTSDCTFLWTVLKMEMNPPFTSKATSL